MASDPESIKGIILKTSEYKEKDRLIKVLCKDRGIVNICVKGVGSKNSKFSFASIPYSYCDMVITESHGFYYLKEGSVIAGNMGIMNSLEAMAVAGHIAELLSLSVMQSENSRDCYELAIYAYYALSEYPGRHLEIMCVFNWKLMWLLGLATIANECALSAGIKLNNRILEILDYIGQNPVSRIFTIKLEPQDISILRKFTLAYISIQFENEVADPIYKLNLP